MYFSSITLPRYSVLFVSDFTEIDEIFCKISQSINLSIFGPSSVLRLVGCIVMNRLICMQVFTSPDPVFFAFEVKHHENGVNDESFIHGQHKILSPPSMAKLAMKVSVA